MPRLQSFHFQDLKLWLEVEKRDDRGDAKRTTMRLRDLRRHYVTVHTQGPRAHLGGAF